MRWVRVVLVLAVAGWAPAASGWESGELRLRGRLQTCFEVEEWTARDGSESRWVSSFRLRRARIDGRWKPADRVRLVLEFEGAGDIRFADRFGPDGERMDARREASIELKDAYGRFEIDRALRVQLGQFKKPFSRLRMESPFDLFLPVRGLLNDCPVNDTRYGGYGGRDVGLMVYGRFKSLARLTYHLGVFSGPRQQDMVESSTKDYVARLQVRPFEGARLAVNWSHKVYHYKEGPTDADLGLVRGHAYTGNLLGADLRVKLAGVTLVLEGAVGDNLDLGPGHLLWGAHGTLYREFELTDGLTLTPAVMVEVYDPDDGDDRDPVLRLAGAVNLDVGELARFVVFAEGGTGAFAEWEAEEGAFVPRAPATRLFLQAQMAF